MATCFTAQSTVSAQEAAMTPLKVGTITKAAATTDLWSANQRNELKRNGLDVTLIEFSIGNDAIAANRGGSIDVFLAIPGTVMIADERGFDLRAVSQNEVAKARGPDSGSLQVLSDSPYKSLADLAGKKIAVSTLHGQRTAAMKTAFKKAGVNPDELQLTELPYASHFEALKSKYVDAVDTIDPFTTQLISSGIGRVVAWDYVDSIPEQPLGAWFATSTFIKKNPATIEKFNTSIKDSIEYMLADPDRARSEVVAYTGLRPELVQSMPIIGWDYHVRLDKWQAVADMMLESGELSSKHSADEFLADQIKPYTSK